VTAANVLLQIVFLMNGDEEVDSRLETCQQT